MNPWRLHPESCPPVTNSSRVDRSGIAVASSFHAIYIFVYRVYIYIKTHGSVSCGQRSRRATPVSILTGRTKTSFSHLCTSVITYLIGTKFATQLPASQGSLHSKFEGNRSSHFRDTSCQSFVFFLRLFAHLQKLL